MALMNKQTGELISEEEQQQPKEEQLPSEAQFRMFAQELKLMQEVKEALTSFNDSTARFSEKTEQLLERDKEQSLLQKDLITEVAAKMANTFDVYCSRVTHQRLTDFGKKIADISAELDRTEERLRRARRPVALILSLSLNIALTAIVAALIVILLIN